jgi:uncharacterized protein with PIN domain
MLGRLGRYLRAAGYDTAFARPGEPDARLLSRAIAEQRRFLTMDRKIMEHKVAADVATVLPMANLDELAAFMQREFDIDWLHAPFSRCLVDNALLLPATPEQGLTVPADAQRPEEPFLACPACGRVYWRGSHVKRMLANMGRWHSENPIGG